MLQELGWGPWTIIEASHDGEDGGRAVVVVMAGTTSTVKLALGQRQRQRQCVRVES